MSDILETAPVLEPERYELHQPDAARLTWTRRELLTMLGGGLLVILFSGSAGAQGGGRGRGGGGGSVPQDVNAWLHVGQDGTVTAHTGKVEVGQNARTSLAQAVAEELRLPVSRVRMIMADTDLVPFDAGTFGSRTTPAMAPQLRRAAAAAREALLDLAAEQMKAERSTLVVADGAVTRAGSPERLTFAQLAGGKKLVRTLSADVPLTPTKDWRVLGQSVPRVDGREMVTGKHRYASDIDRPGMLYGKVLRPEGLNATLESVDASAAEKMPGVTVVRDGSFVGVTAPDELTAAKALKAIRAVWKVPQQPGAAELVRTLRPAGPPSGGPVEAALAQAEVRESATFTVAYIAHAPLEPRAAVAEWAGGRLTVWTGTQRPFGVRGDLAQALGIPEQQVRVIVPDTGSGYGGKHRVETAIEAARLAKAAGKPVRVVWTREEEFSWAYFRPAGVIEVAGGAMKDGTLVAWDFHNYNSGGSSLRSPYTVAARREEFHQSRSPLPQGSYRGLAATANHFAREVQMDRLAHAVGMDPLEFRLKNLNDERLRAVLQAAAERYGWAKRPKGNGRGAGIMVGTEKNSVVAACAEVTADPAKGVLTIHRVVVAFECGAIVNPEHLEQQVEGCVVQGLGGALWEAIDFADGKIANPRFSRYRVPRFGDVPKIETVLLDRKDQPSQGAGETPIVAIAPAVANAVFAACGVQLNAMPMLPEFTKKAA